MAEAKLALVKTTALKIYPVSTTYQIQSWIFETKDKYGKGSWETEK